MIGKGFRLCLHVLHVSGAESNPGYPNKIIASLRKYN